MKIQIVDLELLNEEKLIHVGRKTERYEACIQVRNVEYGAFGKTKSLAVRALLKNLEDGLKHHKKMIDALDNAANYASRKFKELK